MVNILRIRNHHLVCETSSGCRSNWLDSNAVRELAVAIKERPAGYDDRPSVDGCLV